MNSYLMISGATGGLGSAFVHECARRGYSLVLTDRHPQGQEFADLVASSYGVEVLYFPCNLCDPDSRTELFNLLKASELYFWGLINVAGTDFEGAFLERTREQLMGLLRLNIESTMDATYNVLKMRDLNRKFMLINVSSLAAYIPMPFKATYSASKRFILDFSLALREEIREFGTVTALCPAGMPTTPECMVRIFAQGFWGKITTVDTKTAARLALNAGLKGRAVCIPGFLNVFIQWLGSLVPVTLAVKLVGDRWRTAQDELEIWPRVQKPLPFPGATIRNVNSEMA
ncbi:MAG: SDR family NAD(P)-dependent oxidoreductase [Anaerolineaceae bacterium]